MSDDTHGMPPHDTEHEAGFEETHHEEAAPEGEWHGTVDDDFSDDPAAVEMTSTAEEAEASHEMETDPGETPRKRSAILPSIVTIGGILLLGVLIYWQFGNNLRSEPPAADSQQWNKPVAAVQSQPAVAAKTDMVPPSNVPAPPAPVSPPSTTTVAVTTTPVAPAPVAAMAPTPAAAPVAPVTAPPSSPTIAAASLPPSPTVITVAGNEAPKVVSSGNDSRVAMLSAKVDELQKSLDQATQQLSAISNRLAAGSAQQPNLDIENRLNGIEQKLSQMDHTPSSTTTTVTEKTTSTGLPDVETPPLNDLGPVVKKKTVKHTTTTHKTSTRKTAGKAAKSKYHWVLRAASPNEAWIAADANTTDLQPVHVGDEVPGVGIVNEIREEGGMWIVEGTKGTIR